MFLKVINYHFVLKFVSWYFNQTNYFHTNLLIIEFNFLEHDSKQVDFTIPDGNYLVNCNHMIIYYLFILKLIDLIDFI